VFDGLLSNSNKSSLSNSNEGVIIFLIAVDIIASLLYEAFCTAGLLISTLLIFN
jgi:hypothetical protein